VYNDLFLEHIRTYLREHYGEVTDETAQGEHYVLSLTVNGTRREVKAHRYLSAYEGSIAQYLRDSNIAGQLLTGNVEITKPHH